MPRKVEKVIRTLIGIGVGFLLAYAFGALIGQDLNPCHWHWLLKLGVFLAGTVWGLISAVCV